MYQGSSFYSIVATDRPAMTIAVDMGRKATKTNNIVLNRTEKKPGNRRNYGGLIVYIKSCFFL